MTARITVRGSPAVRRRPRASRRVLAIVTALGATLLTASTVSAAAPLRPMHGPAYADPARETVEERIERLHHALKITDTEEPAWRAVAQVMRDNETAMRKLAGDLAPTAGHTATAVEDLRTYAAFGQAHVVGLKSLIEAFETLYNTMPDAQKVNADAVFKKFGRRPHRAQS